MSKQISFSSIQKMLPPGVNPIVFDSLPSTSAYLRELASKGAAEHTLAVASSQTSGHGRFNRAFFSPPDTGVYFSILLRPKPQNDTALLVTVAAALATAEACEAVFNSPAEIKWVNDILVNGRKAVGILAEAFSNDGFFVILGIGANIAPPSGGFPEDLKNAGAFTDSLESESRERFVAETVTRLLSYLENADKPSLVAAYRARVKMTGKSVTVTKATEQFPATVIGIDDDACLIVTRPEGGTEHLSYGEVTLHSENL